MKRLAQFISVLLIGFATTGVIADVKTNLKRGTITNGEVTFITGKQIRFLHRAFPNYDLLAKIVPVTFVSAAKQWFTVPFPDGAPEEITENKLNGFLISREAPFGECSIKILMAEKGPFVLLRFEYKNITAVSVLSGSIPSIDFPEEFVKFAANGQERTTAKTLQNGKNDSNMISSYAAFATEEANQPSVMMIVPNPAQLDFTAGAKITAGGCKRGYGWFPGGGVTHSDFADSNLKANMKVAMDVILAAVAPGKTYAETVAEAAAFYKNINTGK